MGKREHENILLEFSIAMSKIGLDERGEQRSNETTQIPPIPEKRRKNFYWLKTLLTKEIRSAVANPGAEAAALGVAMAEKRVVTAAQGRRNGRTEKCISCCLLYLCEHRDADELNEPDENAFENRFSETEAKVLKQIVDVIQIGK